MKTCLLNKFQSINMHKKTFSLLITLIVTALMAQNKDFNIHEFYPVENSHSYIEFSVKYMGYAKVKGNFEKFYGTFRYDENDLTRTSISISIDVNSLDTDHDRRDQDLRSENWFDSEKFPHIKFISKRIKPNENGFDIIGNLMIKNITKEVTFKMNPSSGVLEDIRGDSQVILTGVITINRTDYNVEGERWSKIKEGISGVSDEVNIELSILGKQINLPNQKNRVRNETRPPGIIYRAVTDYDVMTGLKVFEKMRVDPNNRINFRTLNIVGQTLLKEGKLKESLQVFRKNLEVFSEESIPYNSYAEALAESGDLIGAKNNYQMALERNKNDQNAIEILRYLE